MSDNAQDSEHTGQDGVGDRAGADLSASVGRLVVREYCLSIAAASILAKTYRDDYMNRLHEEFPYYDWDHNKGYPTKKHRAAIAEHGTTPYHRMTFNLLGDGQLTLNF